MSIPEVTHCQFNEVIVHQTSGRSKAEIKKDLSAVQQKVDEEVKKMIEWKHLIPSVTKNIFYEARKKPVETVFKVILIAGMCFISYMLFKGIAAGIEVDVDSDFSDLFSKNITTRLNTGLNLTNGEQAGQFLLDLVLALYGLNKLFIEKPYYKFMSQSLNDAYSKHFSELLVIKNSDNKNMEQFIKTKENLDLLFHDLEKKLLPYEGELNFQNSMI